MQLKEMQECAKETLAFFIQTMPDMPFTSDDITIRFVTKAEIVPQFKAFCTEHAPERLLALGDHHFDALENQVFGNAVTGRKKSAAFIRISHKIDRDTLRRIVFHELMHIYCSKIEMDTEHFIDIYGSGHTPDLDPEDKIYDGQLNAGYAVWSEFVAEYYAVMHTTPERHRFVDIVEPVFNLLDEVRIQDEGAKGSFSMLCAYLLSCADAQDAIASVAEISDDSPEGAEAVVALQNCLVYLYEHMQRAKPCKITEAFIHVLGSKYLMFVLRNSMFMGLI